MIDSFARIISLQEPRWGIQLDTFQGDEKAASFVRPRSPGLLLSENESNPLERVELNPPTGLLERDDRAKLSIIVRYSVPLPHTLQQGPPDTQAPLRAVCRPGKSDRSRCFGWDCQTHPGTEHEGSA